MSIEKLDFNSVKQANKSFTTFLNEVLQNIKDTTSGFIYCYLSSLPPTWEVNVTHLMNHFDIGRDKVKKSLKWLKDNHLLEYEQDRTESGKFIKWTIVIKDGFDFLIHKGLINRQPLSTIPKTSIMESTVLKTQSLDNPVTGKSAPIKYISNRDINTEREKIPLKPISKKIPKSFKPSQKHIEYCLKFNLDPEVETKKFIDHYTSTGEKREKWKPVFKAWIERAVEYNNKQRNNSSRSIHNLNEVRSMVKEWKPGNPDYDRVNNRTDTKINKERENVYLQELNTPEEILAREERKKLIRANRPRSGSVQSVKEILFQ